MAGCCGGGRPLPPNPNLRRRLTNLAVSVANVMAHAMQTGKVRAEKTVVEKRVHICKNCRHLESTRCTVCGCYIVAKAGLAAEKCPMGLW